MSRARHAVLRTLAEHGTPLPAWAAAAATTPPEGWDPRLDARVHLLLTGPLRQAAETHGYDPDLLAPPTHACLCLDDGRIRALLPAAARPAALAAGLAPGTDGVWSAPVSADLVGPLRALVRAHDVAVDPDAAAALRAATTDTTSRAPAPQATPAPPPAPQPREASAPQPREAPATSIGTVTLTGNGRVLVQAPPSKDLVDALTRVPGLRWSDAARGWGAPASRLPEIAALAETHHLALSAEAAARLAELTGPLDYDGTLDGLRGIPVTALACVDDAKAARLATFGIETLHDLLMLTPRRYLDRSTVAPIRSATAGEEAAFIGRITHVQVDTHRRLVRFDVTDNSATIKVTFFNAIWQAKRFRSGDEVILLGKVETWSGGTRTVLQMTNPVMDPVGETTLPIIPVYPQSAKSKVSTWDLHSASAEALARIGQVADPLPAPIRTALGLLERGDALRLVHLPADVEQARVARDRIAFDELFRLQVALLLAKDTTGDEAGIVHTPTGVLTAEYLAKFPYPPTGAQTRALTEIAADMASPHPMHRLLQGDVGSGKTLVASIALLSCVESGNQGALMAPTEILATQLHAELADRLDGVLMPDASPVRVELLTNKTRVKARREILAGLAAGTVHIVVGTHALLVDDVGFARLGLVVVDEQHRFGVTQRARLREKGEAGSRPDMLVMTATPIPRTASMTIFGDLDVSVLDELPPGRTPIATSWVDAEPVLDAMLAEPWETLRGQVASGRQAYVVCPLVEESEKMAAASATETYEALAHGALAGLRVGLVHGQQKPDERETTMNAFRDGAIDVLVATTVIEVGVNVPNASMIVILDPGRFGIAQLHQLRGRVGRGVHASECVLHGRVVSSDGRARMQALVDSTDGFYLSEVDLQLRGVGNLLGEQQSGAMSDLRVADLLADTDLLVAAREHARALLDADPGLARRPGLRHEITTAVGPAQAAWLFRS